MSQIIDEILGQLQTATLYAENTEPGMSDARVEAQHAIEALITQARIEQTQKLAAGIHDITKSERPTDIEAYLAGELCALEQGGTNDE